MLSPLTGDNERAGVVAILDDFEQVAGLVGRERLRTPIIEDEEFDPAERAQQFGIARASSGSAGAIEWRRGFAAIAQVGFWHEAATSECDGMSAAGRSRR